jgi:hypothetical protein
MKCWPEAAAAAAGGLKLGDRQAAQGMLGKQNHAREPENEDAGLVSTYFHAEKRHR